jgi:hypothetical protein
MPSKMELSFYYSALFLTTGMLKLSCHFRAQMCSLLFPALQILRSVDNSHPSISVRSTIVPIQPFSHILTTLPKAFESHHPISGHHPTHWPVCCDSTLGPRISAKSRTRWLLLQTLINNPRLVLLRKSKSGHGSREFTQIPLTCSDCWLWPPTSAPRPG